MTYVVQMVDGTFVHKHEGMNSFVRNPKYASKYYSKEDAEKGKVGHHRDMGGNGFKGRIVSYSSVRWMVNHPRYN